MAFATLEEAWGLAPRELPTLARPPPPAKRAVKMAYGRAQPPRVGSWGPPSMSSPTSSPAGSPWGATTDADMFAARDVIQRAYTSYGLRGLAALLPPELASRVAGGNDSLWTAVGDFVSSPEKVLLVLVLAFLVLVFFESRAASPAPSMRATYPPLLGSMPATSLGA